MKKYHYVISMELPEVGARGTDDAVVELKGGQSRKAVYDRAVELIKGNLLRAAGKDTSRANDYAHIVLCWSVEPEELP